MEGCVGKTVLVLLRTLREFFKHDVRRVKIFFEQDKLRQKNILIRLGEKYELKMGS